jgi:hypothetical protein
MLLYPSHGSLKRLAGNGDEWRAQSDCKTNRKEKDYYLFTATFEYASGMTLRTPTRDAGARALWVYICDNVHRSRKQSSTVSHCTRNDPTANDLGILMPSGKIIMEKCDVLR